MLKEALREKHNGTSVWEDTLSKPNQSQGRVTCAILQDLRLNAASLTHPATVCSSAVWGGHLTASPQRSGLYRVKEHGLKYWLSGPVPTAMQYMQHLNPPVITLLC